MNITKHGTTQPFYTTSRFWDCACYSEYIKPNYLLLCYACGRNKSESPDSRVNEVIVNALSWKLDENLYSQMLSDLEKEGINTIPFK